jgi:hypothetical protein
MSPGCADLRHLRPGIVTGTFEQTIPASPPRRRGTLSSMSDRRPGEPEITDPHIWWGAGYRKPNHHANFIRNNAG